MLDCNLIFLPEPSSNASVGEVCPIPTLPEELITIRLVEPWSKFNLAELVVEPELNINISLPRCSAFLNSIALPLKTSIGS